MKIILTTEESKEIIGHIRGYLDNPGETDEEFNDIVYRLQAIDYLLTQVVAQVDADIEMPFVSPTNPYGSEILK